MEQRDKRHSKNYKVDQLIITCETFENKKIKKSPRSTEPADFFYAKQSNKLGYT